MKKNINIEVEALTKKRPVDGSGKTESYTINDSELSLSNPGQLALLKSIAELGVPLRTAVRGLSMHPFICDRDVLTIAPLKGHHLALGDVVAFACSVSNRLVIHRIIAKSASGWLIKGDNCSETDGLVEREQIIGYVIRIERGTKEIRFCLGYEKKLIAFLNRGSSLFRIKKIWHLFRRILIYK